MQSVYSLKKWKQTKEKTELGVCVGGQWRGTRAEGQEGQILVADNRELQ